MYPSEFDSITKLEADLWSRVALLLAIQNVAPCGELILGPKSGRKFVVHSPATVISAELKRIQDWLGFQLLVQAPGEAGLS